MIGVIDCPRLAELSSEPFSGDDAVNGVVADPSPRRARSRAGRGRRASTIVLAFYGAAPRAARADPVIFLRGDALELRDGVLVRQRIHRATSPRDVQALASSSPRCSAGRTCISRGPASSALRAVIATGAAPREVALVDAALTRLKQRFGWRTLNLVGQSGGGHLVAALIARRSDIDCAVIASGNTAVAQRNREHGWTTDITGHADFLDPIDHVADVARHPPSTLIVLTDPQDARVSASVQTAYVEALRAAGVARSTIASCQPPASCATTCRPPVSWPPSPISRQGIDHEAHARHGAGAVVDGRAGGRAAGDRRRRLRRAVERDRRPVRASSGHKIMLRYGDDAELIGMARTTPFDFAVTPPKSSDDDAAAKLPPGPMATIARVGLGVAVTAGAPKPDIASPDALKKALLSARSVATAAGQRRRRAGA